MSGVSSQGGMEGRGAIVPASGGRNAGCDGAAWWWSIAPLVVRRVRFGGGRFFRLFRHRGRHHGFVFSCLCGHRRAASRSG